MPQCDKRALYILRRLIGSSRSQRQPEAMVIPRYIPPEPRVGAMIHRTQTASSGRF